MTPELTDDQRGAWKSGAGMPIPILDQSSQQTFFLVSAAQMKTVEALLELGEFDAKELYPLTEQAALEAGWNEPSMDVYDDYDAHRQ